MLLAVRAVDEILTEIAVSMSDNMPSKHCSLCILTEQVISSVLFLIRLDTWSYIMVSAVQTLV